LKRGEDWKEKESRDELVFSIKIIATCVLVQITNDTIRQRTYSKTTRHNKIVIILAGGHGLGLMGM